MVKIKNEPRPMDELLAADDFTISELCLIFGRCRETIRLWRKAGKIFPSERKGYYKFSKSIVWLYFTNTR